MSFEENKALVRRVFEEGINRKNLAVFEAVIGPTYINHDMPMSVPGPEGFKQVVGAFLTAFPDMQITLEDVLAEGDKVVTRGVFRGTHRAEFLGVPATGKPVEVKYIDLWRLENGQPVENWVQIDMLGLLQQLGAVPAPGQAAG
jgi:steroid delta-isomerase-like uncharacterized protein